MTDNKNKTEYLLYAICGIVLALVVFYWHTIAQVLIIILKIIFFLLIIGFVSGKNSNNSSSKQSSPEKLPSGCDYLIIHGKFRKGHAFTFGAIGSIYDIKVRLTNDPAIEYFNISCTSYNQYKNYPKYS